MLPRPLYYDAYADPSRRDGLSALPQMTSSHPGWSSCSSGSRRAATTSRCSRRRTRVAAGPNSPAFPVHRFRYFPAAGEESDARGGRARSHGPVHSPQESCPRSYLAAGLPAIWRLARRRRYDIIHVHWPLPHMLFGWAAQRADRGGARIVTTWYGVELRWVKSSLKLLKGFVRRALRASDEVCGDFVPPRHARSRASSRSRSVSFPTALDFRRSQRCVPAPRTGRSRSCSSVGLLRAQRRDAAGRGRAPAAAAAALEAGARGRGTRPR